MSGAAPLGRLPSGRRCYVSAPRLPLIPFYYVLHTGAEGGTPSTEDICAMWAAAYVFARQAARRHLGDAESFSLLFNAGRTRRRGWPHVHVVLARSPREKRRVFVLLSLKRLLRWWRWPWLVRCAAVFRARTRPPLQRRQP